MCRFCDLLCPSASSAICTSTLYKTSSHSNVPADKMVAAFDSAYQQTVYVARTFLQQCVHMFIFNGVFVPPHKHLSTKFSLNCLPVSARLLMYIFIYIHIYYIKKSNKHSLL